MTKQMDKSDSTGILNKRLHQYRNRNSILLDKNLLEKIKTKTKKQTKSRQFFKNAKKDRSNSIEDYIKRVVGFTNHASICQRVNHKNFELSNRFSTELR